MGTQEQNTREKEAFSEIMRRFKFRRVATAMAAVGWKYHDKTESPTEDELYQTARELFEHLSASPDSKYVYSGGLKVSRDSEDGSKLIRLEFILEESDRPV